MPTSLEVVRAYLWPLNSAGHDIYVVRRTVRWTLTTTSRTVDAVIIKIVIEVRVQLLARTEHTEASQKPAIIGPRGGQGADGEAKILPVGWGFSGRGRTQPSLWRG